MENSRNKQFMSFILQTVLSSMMKSHTDLLSPLDMNPFSQHIHTINTTLLFISHLIYQIHC
jgi:hypothetical protein